MKAINNAVLAVVAALIASALVASGDTCTRANTDVNAESHLNGNHLTSAQLPVEKRDLVITRVLDAPLERVWKAWSDPEYVMRWWGPTGFTACECKIDFREGGKFVFCMRAPKEFQAGRAFYSAGVYKKIVPLRLIEFTQGLSDKDGNSIDPVTMGMPADFPKEIPSALAFKAVGNKTELTATEYGWPVGQMRDMSEAGLNQCLDKLAALLAKR